MDVFKSFCDRERIFCGMKEGCKVSWVKYFLAGLLGSQYLREILPTSLTVKNGENMVKSGCFEKNCDGECQIFLEVKKRYKVSCLKLLIFCSFIKRSVFIWNIAHLTLLENY